MKKRKFDIITCSKELKKVIVERLKDINLSLYKACEISNVDYKKFSTFMNTSDPLNPRVRIYQEEVISFCDKIGIHIKLTIILNPIKEIEWKKKD